jgi:hypothetical protein
MEIYQTLKNLTLKNMHKYLIFMNVYTNKFTFRALKNNYTPCKTKLNKTILRA